MLVASCSTDTHQARPLGLQVTVLCTCTSAEVPCEKFLLHTGDTHPGRCILSMRTLVIVLLVTGTDRVGCLPLLLQYIMYWEMISQQACL